MVALLTGVALLVISLSVAGVVFADQQEQRCVL